MNTGSYSNRGEDVPLGMESALPYLDAVAEVFLQQTDSGEHEGRSPLVSLGTANCTPSPNGDRIVCTYPTLYLVKAERHAATLERLDPVHS